ncbi:glycerophosphodiester phosphodiesterase family protein [Halomonas huangheensis]|uniref:ubiquitinyl hydrolase 1 n=1 Tax=Halomonas huangheensis TaxID=1178482 RepID=W1NCN9_9GAMM|nr:glycerophosphodiester phosphodiesterase family protein [Halomonas huangheensis]ALM52755.1 hypothetical protein AR456_11055 [Halomonas huangheensis]ERL52705.1 hypothetical protein BJB45_15610 [Halomonas huangheensis]
MMPLVRDVLASLRDHLRPLLAGHLLFTLLASGLLIPAMAWALAGWLSRVGQPLITSADALDLLLSPWGLLWVYGTFVLILSLLYLQQACMMQITLSPRSHHAQQAFVSLWLAVHRLPWLVVLSMIQVACHLLMLTLMIYLVTQLHHALLGELDPYYVRRVRPPAFWYFIAYSLPLVGTWLIIAGRLLVRWWLALPCVVLERVTPVVALKRSMELTRQDIPRLATAVFTTLVVILLLPSLTSMALSSLLGPLLTHLPENNALVIAVMLLIVSVVTLVTLAVAFAVIALNALLATCLYLRRAHRRPRPSAPPSDAHPGRLAWAVEVGVVIFALSQAILFIDRQDLRDNIQVIAHRGSSWAAPENSISAIRQALDDGADLVEIDVRLSADGVVVLSHDASLNRLIGDERRIADLDWTTMAALDVGTGFSHAYAGEPIASLQQALETARGRASLVIELKPERGDEKRLLDAVMSELYRERDWRVACRATAEDALQREQCGNPRIFEDSWLATLSYRQLVEIDRSAPEARSILLAEWSLPSALPRDRFDALGLRHSQIDHNEVERAHQADYQLFAWTVNQPGQMARLLDMGVDGIITDRPDRLAALLDERRQLGDGALLLLKLRHWLADG